MGGVEPREHLREPVYAGHVGKASAVEGVEADVDPLEAGLAVAVGLPREGQPVGGHGQVVEAGDGREAFDDLQ